MLEEASEDMKTITFTCETITPMFLSGADQSIPELRPPSIKGALRFWWRALNGHLSLEELKKQESEIFGGTEPAQRSKVIITCPRDKNFLKPSTKDRFPQHRGNYPLSRNTPVNILNYLAYGAYDYREGFTHAFFDEGQQFNICLRFTDEKKVDEVIKAFVLMCYVGGLGSKSRNGFGKIKIIKAIESEDNTATDITQNLPKWKDLLKTTNPKSKFTSLSSSVLLFKARDVINGTYDNALKVIGDAYIHARKNMGDGHTYDTRRYIAAPIVQDRNAFLERHSKSYFLFLDEENGGYTGYILFVPYEYVSGISNENLKKGKSVPPDAIIKFNDATQKFNTKLQEKLNLITL
ncbi:MAG: type III-B CRISPR module RAMP protein Cmr1 [Thermaurantimonas sp.]|uniref:type III-B CRISPR module RAMP protein Cmr1 n=1 Tax=Thermaurantimonas sp. TaxID=2681568 RepID=UPI00391A13D9